MAGSAPDIRGEPMDEDDRRWIRERTVELFNGEVVISRGVAHRPDALPGFVAWSGGARVGLTTYRVDGDACELVTVDALQQWRGIGTALTWAVERAAREAGCRRLWLITTNDNTDGLRFYQRRGFRLSALHAGAIAHSRTLKPAIPALGSYRIPIRDEIELDKGLDEAGS